MTPTDLPGGAILTCQSWVHRAGAIEVLHGDSRDPAEKAQDRIRAHGPHQTAVSQATKQALAGRREFSTKPCAPRPAAAFSVAL